MNIHTIGIDLGKTSFHLVGLSDSGEVIVRKHFSRTQLLRFTGSAWKPAEDPTFWAVHCNSRDTMCV